MPINDTDQLLVNDGSKTETITFAQLRDGTVFNDTDKFLINDGTKTETVTWAEIEEELGPKGTVDTPIVLKPSDGAGSGDTIYLKSDTITAIGDGGVETCETDLIQSIDSKDEIVGWTLSDMSFNNGVYYKDQPSGDYTSTLTFPVERQAKVTFAL